MSDDQRPTIDAQRRTTLMRWLLVGGLWSVVRLALALIVLWQGARLVFRADPRDALRRIDVQFTSGRYYDALQEAAALPDPEPHFAPGGGGVGLLRAIRDGQPGASQSLGYAIGL